MRIYEEQTRTGDIVWTTYRENGKTYEGRGFRLADWKARVRAQRRYLAAEKKWCDADRRFTRAMKESRYALVNNLNWTDAGFARCERIMRNAEKAMAEADAVMAEVRAYCA
jgi:hypothetical protein